MNADLQTNTLLQEEESRLKAEYLTLVSWELILLQQKEKVHWLKMGDTNSSFFHAKIKERRTNSRITSIHNSEGILLTETIVVEEEFLSFFTELLGTKFQTRAPVDVEVLRAGHVLRNEQHELLCKPVTNEEIKEDFWSISPLKAPGPDGFSSGFFKASWNIIGNDVSLAIKDFFCSSKFLKQVNTTLLSLIPKTNYPNGVGDYRPIACCNVIYKAITKILTKRLQGVIGQLISESQGAFVRERSIIDNIMVCQGLVRNYTRENGAPRCLIKMDIKKTYDTLE